MVPFARSAHGRLLSAVHHLVAQRDGLEQRGRAGAVARAGLAAPYDGAKKMHRWQVAAACRLGEERDGDADVARHAAPRVVHRRQVEKALEIARRGRLAEAAEGNCVASRNAAPLERKLAECGPAHRLLDAAPRALDADGQMLYCSTHVRLVVARTLRRRIGSEREQAERDVCAALARRSGTLVVVARAREVAREPVRALDAQLRVRKRRVERVARRRRAELVGPRPQLGNLARAHPRGARPREVRHRIVERARADGARALDGAARAHLEDCRCRVTLAVRHRARAHDRRGDRVARGGRAREVLGGRGGVGRKERANVRAVRVRKRRRAE